MKYKISPSFNSDGFSRGPWRNFHSYCWHKAKNKFYPTRPYMIGLPADMVSPIVSEELIPFNGVMFEEDICFDTEEDLAFFILRWS